MDFFTLGRFFRKIFDPHARHWSPMMPMSISRVFPQMAHL
jgi:hypothetical protein